MKKINILFFIFLFNFCFSQIRLTNIDTVDTKYYKNTKLLKSFVYKREFPITSGGSLYVLYDSICDKSKQKQRLVYATDPNTNYLYFKDSLIVRYWDMHNSGPQFENYFEVSIILKSKNYDNLIISSVYNRDNLFCKQFVIGKPDSLHLYYDETYVHNKYKDIKFTEKQAYNLKNGRSLSLEFNDRNLIENLRYFTTNNDELVIRFQSVWLPKEYGFYKYYNNIKQSRYGLWYTYYDNSKLESEGEYCSSKFEENGKEYDIKKTGKWIYYTKEGCIDKEENWDNGVLIYPLIEVKKKITKKKNNPAGARNLLRGR